MRPGTWCSESWSDAVTDWTQSGTDDIVKTLGSSQTKRYWKVTVSSITNPMAGEIIMGLAYEFDILARPDPVAGDLSNVAWTRSIGGQERGIQIGGKRRLRTYGVSLNSSELSSFRQIVEDIEDYSKHFLFKDADGEWFLARFEVPPQEIYYNISETRLHLRVMEAL